MHRIRQKLLLLLCIALLCAMPVSSLHTYAFMDDDGVYYDDDDGDDESFYEDDEPDTTSNAAVNSQIADLQRQIEKVNSELANYQEQQKKIENEISSARTEKEKAAAVRNNFSHQIVVTEGEISSLEQRIALLEADIAQKGLEIQSKQGDIDYNYKLFKTRLRAQYMQDDGTVLGLLLGADSFSDFLTRTEYMNRIAQHDRDLMEFLTEERIAIEEIQKELEQSKLQVEDDRTQTVARKQDLSAQYSAAALQVQSIEQMEQEYMANLAKNKAQQDAAKAVIDQLYKTLEFTKNAYAGGEMAWPLPGYSTISSGFGMRFGGSDYHTGTDITGSGCNGSSIVAANDGVVAYVNTSYTQGVGYGIYVLLDHGVNENGQSVSTLYAHCSSVAVSTGQSVKKGQHIASVGSTGWSTGPHLHFEVRLNGSAVNALPYIRG